MTIPKTPRPMLALFGAVVAHVAFLIAPDVKSMPAGIAMYGLAAAGTLVLIVFLLLPLGRRDDQRPHLRGELAGRLAETLVFVGAGYCSNVEPGVIKLFGVLPLGWSCAVMALFLQFLGVLGLARGLDCRHSWDRDGTLRMTWVTIATVVEAAFRLGDWTAPTDGRAFNTMLFIVLLGVVVDGTRSTRDLLHAIPPEKD